MKEQWLAQYQTKWSKERNMWLNATWLQTGEKRYCDTKEEALMYLNKAVEQNNRSAKNGSTQEIGHTGLGISFEPNDGLTVVSTRLRVRKVTEWEEV